MVPQLKRAIVVAVSLLSALLWAGCSGGESDVPPETDQSKAAAQQAASNWTPEQKATFQESLNRAHSGEEGNGRK